MLNRLQNGDAFSIVTYPEALAEKVVSAQRMDEHTLKLKVGMDYGVEHLEEVLFEHGYIGFMLHYSIDKEIKVAIVPRGIIGCTDTHVVV